MSETLGKGLSPQLRERLAAQREAIEAQTVSALQQLSTSCQACVRTELHTISSVMAEQSALVRRSLARLWFWSGSLGVALVVGVSLGSWGLGLWLTSSLERQLAERSALQAEIAAQHATLSQLEHQTWGVGYQETEQGRFLTLPPGSKPGWQLGGRPAVRLSPP